MNGAGMRKSLETLEGSIVTSEVSQLVAGYSFFFLSCKTEECGTCGHNENPLGSSVLIM